MDDDQGSEDDNVQPQNIVTKQKDNTHREPSSYLGIFLNLLISYLVLRIRNFSWWVSLNWCYIQCFQATGATFSIFY